MSGFAVEIASDGRPIEQQQLDRLARSLRFRAPDGEQTHALADAGFAFALMQVDGDPPAGRQPLCLEDRWWIAAHARLYARADLVRDLRGAGTSAEEDQSDALLILLAHRVWGTDCLQHLNGDFSFALWDAHTRTLFCACDHFGIRPLFYSQRGQTLRVSNTLSCLRDCYADAAELDDSFIADFVAFEFSLTPEATAYRCIRRLPPAHFLTARHGEPPTIRRYWSLPEPAIDLRISRRETRRQFRETLRAAVQDRLPDGPVSLWLSGGMDSTAITAIAAEHVSRHRGKVRLSTFTAGSLQPARDPEPPLAQLVASHLGVPHKLFDVDQHAPWENWEQETPFMPEPWHEPFWRRKVMGLREVAQRSRVTIGGEGGDELLAPELTVDLLGRIPARRLAGDVIRHVARYHRLPPMGARRTWRRWRGVVPDYGEFSRVPAWLNRGFAADWRLAERLADLHRTSDDPVAHSSRPMGVNRLSWSTQITRDTSDAGTIGVPLELRKPFLDVRLVRFMYSIPPLYWCSRKAILREALAGHLPDQILRRPKTSVPGNPLWDSIKKFGMPWCDHFQPCTHLERYVDVAAWRALCAQVRVAPSPPPTLLRDMLPVSLNYWLRSLDHAA